MDSFEGRMTDPMSLHKYLYAHANPVMGTDPGGHFTMVELESAVMGLTYLATIYGPYIYNSVVYAVQTGLLQAYVGMVIRAGEILSKYPSSAKLTQRVFSNEQNQNT